jgi:dTDP-4-dehydrorhamnose 3,5-epimerase
VQVEPTAIEGVLILTPRRFADARGWFEETWNRDRMREAGLDLDWAQDNHSMSVAAGTVRGLHYQAPPRAQAKLVRVLAGAILDVAVDARAGSPSFGRHVAVELSADNGRQLLIPEGFLHGFATRAPMTHVAYKCTDTWSPAHDGAVAWDDPDLGIDWSLGPGEAQLSDKDRAAPRWRDWTTPFRPEARA